MLTNYKRQKQEERRRTFDRDLELQTIGLAIQRVNDRMAEAAMKSVGSWKISAERYAELKSEVDQGYAQLVQTTDIESFLTQHNNVNGKVKNLHRQLDYFMHIVGAGVQNEQVAMLNMPPPYIMKVSPVNSPVRQTNNTPVRKITPMPDWGT
jgi:hypothetical protein